MRRGYEVLIAQQQLNVAVVDQLHAARSRFTPSLQSIAGIYPQGTTTKAAGERNYSKNPLRGRVGRQERTYKRNCKTSELDTQVERRIALI
jgi:hypothetical protein